jgi:hypothetical protein
MLILLMVLLSWLSLSSGDSSPLFTDGVYPVCTKPKYNSHGRIDVQSMIYNCSDNIQGAMFPPSYFSGIPTHVNVSLAFNTLIDINDVDATITLDFWMRVYWHDGRWKFPPELWDGLSESNSWEGLELTPYIRAQTDLAFWVPDVYILESIQWEVRAELLHLFPDGNIWWSR